MAGLGYSVAFPVQNGCVSPSPNPYTSTFTASSAGVTTFLNPQTFQIISSGIDGLYGVGGQYSPDNTGESLPLDPNNLVTRGQHHPGPRAGQHHQLP